jgi:hypothetical protein
MDEADRFASWRSAEPYYGSNAKSKLCYGHDDVYRGAGRSEKDFVRTQGYLRITRCMDGLNLGLGPRSDRWSHSLDLGKRFSLSLIDVSVPRKILEDSYYVISKFRSLLLVLLLYHVLRMRRDQEDCVSLQVGTFLALWIQTLPL